MSLQTHITQQPPPAGKTPTGENPAVVLLVDDDPDCRMLIRDAIEEAVPGTLVCEVCDAEKAWEFLRNTGKYGTSPRPTLIYVDVEMPHMNGIELAAMLKLDKTLTDIPIVMLTGVCDEQRMHAAAACGANSYTIKPNDAMAFHNNVAAATKYWLTVHQSANRHVSADLCRR